MSETPNLPAIEMRGVNVVAMRDASFNVVAGVNWLVAPGEFWVIAGTQHSGKSDFLKLAAGLIMPVKGSYKLFGFETQNLGEAELAKRLQVGFVFEGGQLFNQLTLRENISLPLQYHRDLTAAAAGPEVQTLLELLELADLAEVLPPHISSNWLQRAALARALILKPDLLLLDNPLSRLDARHLQWWLRFLNRLCRGHEWRGGKPMTLVATTNDLRPWQGAQRKFALLHDGKFSTLGSWNDVETAGDPVVKELLAVPVDEVVK